MIDMRTLSLAMSCLLFCFVLAIPADLIAQSDLVASLNIENWSWTLTQRGSSTTWDAVWTQGGNRVVAVLEGSIVNGQLRMRRVQSSDNILCEYAGTVAPDGRSLSGTQTCPGYPVWSFSGRITGGRLQTPSGASPRVLNLTCDSWSGVWTQRGSSTVWDAVWTSGGNRVTAVMEGTVQDGKIALRRVSSSDGVLCQYQGTISADGRISAQQVCPGYPNGNFTCSGRASGEQPCPSDFSGRWISDEDPSCWLELSREDQFVRGMASCRGRENLVSGLLHQGRVVAGFSYSTGTEGGYASYSLLGCDRLLGESFNPDGSRRWSGRYRRSP